MASTVTERYAALVAQGEIERDDAQEAVAAKLTRLEARLAAGCSQSATKAPSGASTSTATSGAARPC
jgi:predicted ATPase